MKKKFLIGLIVLLSVSLFFWGCSTDDEEEETGETFTDVTDQYDLVGTVSSIPTIGNGNNLDITASKSDLNGIVYITVTGTLTGTSDFGSSHGLWGPKRENAPAGKWADFGLDLNAIFTSEVTNKILALRSSNQAFRYYKGASNLLAQEPTGPLVILGDPNKPIIYIPALPTEMPVKWRLYNTNTFSSDKLFAFILWSSANPKTITLEVAEYATYVDNAAKSADVATIVIDYSGVTIE
jgi:hypothetical protein